MSKTGMSNLFATCITKASSLLHTNKVICATEEPIKYAMIFSALLPVPEAKMAIRMVAFLFKEENFL